MESTLAARHEIEAALRPGEAMDVKHNGMDSVAFWSLSIVGAMLLLDLAGHFVDYRFGTSPWFLLGGYAVGLSVILYAVIATDRGRRRGREPQRKT
jgi:F0F1-type ATP synthase assembly protein I